MSDPRARFQLAALGVASGLLVADVLLALNPDHGTFGPALSLLLAGALVGFAVAVPVVLLMERLASPRGSGAALCVLLAFGAAFAESQRRLFHAFLPNGARRVLVATSLLAALSLALLLVALLRSSSTRPAVAASLVLLSLPGFAARRANAPTALASPPALPRHETRSLLVVGLDGVSWELLSKGASENALPVLARLLESGVGGPLASLAPYDRAALFTTAATGKSPAKHDVVSGGAWDTPLGPFRLVPRMPGASAFRALPLLEERREPATRKSLTFWEILARLGHEASVLNWPASYPAAQGLVLWATEEMFAGEVSPAAARPREAADRARLFLVNVGRLDRPLVHALTPAGLTENERAAALAGAARDLAVASVALGSVPGGPGNVEALVLSGATRTSPIFGPAAEAERYWGRSPRAADARATALRGYYRFLDDVLGDLLAREGKDRTICVFSPGGWGPAPPLSAFSRFLSGREPVASPEASLDGFLVLSGPGIRSGVRLTSASVLDLAPTLLVLAGEPIARDMDGRVLAEAFDARFAESASIPIVTTFESGGPQ